MFSPLFIVWLLIVDYFNKLLTVQSVNVMSVYLTAHFQTEKTKGEWKQIYVGIFQQNTS